MHDAHACCFMSCLGEDQEDEDTPALTSMLQPKLTINTIATSHAQPSITSPTHHARCAVDGCRQTRSSRGYCTIHAAMHSPLTSPSAKHTHSTPSKHATLHLPTADDDSLSTSHDLFSDTYDASHDGLTQTHPQQHGLKLDFSNMDLAANRQRWAVDAVSDSFEV